MQARARTFLRRELQVLNSQSVLLGQEQHRRHKSNLRERQATTDYLIEFIIAVLRTHDPKSFDGRAEELLAEFMAINNARLLLHELTHWLRSPYARLYDWDEAVQY